jgi:hypothetical protein
VSVDERLERRLLRDELYRAAAAGLLDQWRPDELDRAGLDLLDLAAIKAGKDGIAWQNDLIDEPKRWWRTDVEPPPGWVAGDAQDVPARLPVQRDDGRQLFLSRCGDLTGITPPDVIPDDVADPADRWW